MSQLARLVRKTQESSIYAPRFFSRNGIVSWTNGFVLINDDPQLCRLISKSAAAPEFPVMGYLRANGRKVEYGGVKEEDNSMVIERITEFLDRDVETLSSALQSRTWNSPYSGEIYSVNLKIPAPDRAGAVFRKEYFDYVAGNFPGSELCMTSDCSSLYFFKDERVKGILGADSYYRLEAEVERTIEKIKSRRE